MKDPFKYTNIALSLSEAVGYSADFPDYFPISTVAEIFSTALNGDVCDLEDPVLWDSKIRRILLSSLKNSCRLCTKCELHKNREKNNLEVPYPVFGEGVLDPLVMVVSEGPGETEGRTGLPMVGQVELRASNCVQCCEHFEECFINKGAYKRPTRECEFEDIGQDNRHDRVLERLKRKEVGLHSSGELLDDVLAEAGLVRQTSKTVRELREEMGVKNIPQLICEPNVYVTNAVRCRSLKDGKNAPPSKEQVAACNPYLELTIRIVKPLVCVALGIPAAEAMGLSKISVLNPSMVGSSLHDCIWTCFHPSYAMRGDTASLKKQMVNVFKSAKGRALELKEKELGEGTVTL